MPADGMPADGMPKGGAPAVGATIAPMKECPLCGENMRLSVREVQDRVPGVSRPTARIIREWICPECDYFEEVDTEG